MVAIQGRWLPVRVVVLTWCLVVKILKDHRSVTSVKQPQCRLDDLALKSRVIRRAQGPPQFERNPKRTRWLDLLRVLPNESNRRGRQALAFKEVCKRANGTRARRSDWYQKNRIYRVSNELPGQLPGMRLHLGRLGGAHKGIVRIGDPANDTLAGEFV